ncbi:hypothetical protein LSH36_261g01018 [Paralvinella palmiformis]|uniref:Chitin-binding type-2 domain-containing protein n=1 Tax=Paralvinella palmiformis TaxID=53620 RepID=A0AAD9JLG9_9ANNE|nr:hypothetical protein LSH36_261g01018 [Paralvinella palmiformis]
MLRSRRTRLICVLWIFTFCVAVFGFECPTNEEGECIDGTYGNVYNCSTYWSCSECEAWLQICPNPLEFNDEIKACVSHEESNCEEITTTTTTSTTTTTTATTTTATTTTATTPTPTSTTTDPTTTTTTSGQGESSPPPPKY